MVSSDAAQIDVFVGSRDAHGGPASAAARIIQIDIAANTITSLENGTAVIAPATVAQLAQFLVRPEALQ